jgi:hypothetical protein
VFAPFHYGHWEPAGDPGDADDTRDTGHRLANELTMTVWDPVSKQPYFKTAACRVTKVRDGDGPAPAPTTTASAPAGDRLPQTVGGPATRSEVLAETPSYPLDPARTGPVATTDRGL